ncbi:MAG: hypothetical protein ACOCXM_04445 [Myxococcota bacterium]
MREHGPRRLALPALALVLAAVGGAHPARGQGLTADRVRQAATDLRAEDGQTRARAWNWLSRLGPDALPAVRKRIGELERRRVQGEAARDALFAFRHAVGSRRADDRVDIAPGVRPVLDEQRDAVTVAMAERLALARSLEGMGTLEAGEALCDLMGIEDAPWPWRWESVRIVDRMGVRALPMLLVAAGHESRFVRRWGRRGVDELGLAQPGTAVRKASQAGSSVLADLLRAYGRARIMDAMPVVVAFVDDPRRQVRQAARAGVRRYGRNIIWQIRRKYLVRTGREASSGWSTERTRRELYSAIDRQRLAPAREALEKGLAAFRDQDLHAMERHFDQVLRRAPGEPSLTRAMVGGWAALGEERLERGEYHAAANALRRALAPGGEEGDQARRWQALLSLAEAERALSSGVVDLPAYEQALALHPGLGAAARALDRLGGSAAERERTRRRWASGLAALLLGFAGLALLRRRRAPSEADEDEEGEDDTETAPSELAEPATLSD